MTKRKRKSKNRKEAFVALSPRRESVTIVKISRTKLEQLDMLARDTVMNLNTVFMSDPVLTSSNHERLKDARKNAKELVLLLRQEAALLG